ncbi:MAG: hypothetical protein AAGG69_15775 [Pseudomonadota bacterium]
MPNRKNIFRSAFDAMADARAREVTKYVNGMLLMLDDDALRSRGLNRADLEKGRKPFL